MKQRPWFVVIVGVAGVLFGALVVVGVLALQGSFSGGGGANSGGGASGAREFTSASAPTIGGTLQVGNVLAADPGVWSPEPAELEYQWYADGDAITGATASTLELTYVRADQAISVLVLASKPGLIDTTRSSAPTTAVLPTFVDVPTSAPFYYEIQWMWDSGITGGAVDGGLRTFHPLEPVSREQMAALLYTAAGSPAFVAPETATFTDVPVGSAYWREIEWMKSEGIANGNEDGTFLPLAPVSRQAVAAFLYRSAGSPEFAAPATPSFTDLPSDAPFSLEVEWLTAEGVTTGFANGDGTWSFRPTDPVTRQAIAAFLYRAFN